MSARKCAFEAIGRIIDKGAYNNLALSTLFEKYNLKDEDKSLCGIIVKGVTERKLTLDYLIQSLSAFQINDLDKRVLNLLRMGLYQILFLDRVPDFAVCNESAEIANDFGKKKKGFVNGVLRTACRKKQELLKEIENAPCYIKYSLNEDLYNLLYLQYGDEISKIALGFFEKSGTALRVNSLKTTADDLLNILEKNGVECEKLSERTIIVNAGMSKALSMVDEGLFYVQGISSQKAVEVLDAQKGDFIIDVCACPGGKTIGAAMDMKNEGCIVAFDIHENKLPLIQKNGQNLGITIITTKKHNSKTQNEEYIGKADKVICDVPCSGIGSIGKRPEIRYKSISDINGLEETQRDILKASSRYLKKMGTLVYSVCSINKNEGVKVVREFLEENKEFSLDFEETVLPQKGCDGFYIAKIIRNV